MDNQPPNLLADMSREPIKVGNPPMLIFNEAGQRLDRELISLSAQLRTAEALERIATILEASMPLAGPVNSEMQGFLRHLSGEGQPS